MQLRLIVRQVRKQAGPHDEQRIDQVVDRAVRSTVASDSYSHRICSPRSETLREPTVRALRGLTDPQIEGFIAALTSRPAHDSS